MKRFRLLHVHDRLHFDFSSRYGGRYTTSTINRRPNRVAWFSRRPEFPPALRFADVANGKPPE